MQNFFGNILDWLLAHPLWAISALLVFFFLVDQFIFWIRFARALMLSKKMIYMRVMLPRSDTEKDKEKEVEKDFREKVGVMSQFYRNLHEIRELNIWNTIRSWIFNLDMVSFELVVQEKLVYFYIVTYPYFKELVEKQVTSYYPDADVEFVKPYEICPNGNKLKMFYMHTVKPFWFPIKTFKVVENDPLNDMSNVLSKLENGETAAIQLIINPRSEKWRKKAEQMGTLLFKGKDIDSFSFAEMLYKIPMIGIFFKLTLGLFLGIKKLGGGKSNAPGASGGESYVRMLQPK